MVGLLIEIELRGVFDCGFDGVFGGCSLSELDCETLRWD